VHRPQKARHVSPLSRADRVFVSALVLVVALCGVGAFLWIYGSHLAEGEPIRSDAVGYYIYLPAVILDHDVTLERTAERSFAGHTPDMSGVRRVPPRGRYLDKYPVGEAIMLVPFFAFGDATARAAGARANGFTRPYQYTAAAGGLVYALCGIWMLGVLLLRWFSRVTVGVTLAAITFGTGLFHYATYDAVYSHAFSFFLVAAILWLALSAYEAPRLATAVALGLATGLLVAVRPTNAVILVFVALVGVASRQDALDRIRTSWRRRRLFALGVAAFVVPLLPQVGYWHTITGKFYVYAYGDEHLDLLRPHLFDVAFSVRKGLFFWAPVLLLAVVGLPFLRRRAPDVFVPAVAYLAVTAWVIASWSTWWYGESLGQRAFVETLPVFALGLAALIESCRGRMARPALVCLVSGLTLLGVHNMLAYWQHRIPFDRTTWHAYVRSFDVYG
jgi:hypothetical protein